MQIKKYSQCNSDLLPMICRIPSRMKDNSFYSNQKESMMSMVERSKKIRASFFTQFVYRIIICIILLYCCYLIAGDNSISDFFCFFIGYVCSCLIDTSMYLYRITKEMKRVEKTMDKWT